MSDPLATLISDLEAARAIKADDVENLPRATVVHAVDAAHRYLASIGIEDRLRAPLLHLLGALQDLEQGRTNPILAAGPYTPTKQHTRQIDTAEFVMASYAVTIMSEQPNVSTDKALEEMAAVIGTEKKTLREFRKNISKGRATDEAKREYAEWRTIRRQFKEMPADKFVEAMKDKAKRLRFQKG
ncbi:hypothetical protein [Mesorhizobium sp. L2C067A000]|uniref:hypothetical protein n=1 Tax=Mesorhizobium sp. L2C067A000 TaxID=1287106 RepID=UPI0003CFE235|nr:hypothetical protein [Mesorhizobium sp. L2C067A000]ESZ31252.1 hypothetical protein X733_22550 [Mesorhizobium sp. L2C067A000]